MYLYVSGYSMSHAHALLKELELKLAEKVAVLEIESIIGSPSFTMVFWRGSTSTAYHRILAAVEQSGCGRSQRQRIWEKIGKTIGLNDPGFREVQDLPCTPPIRYLTKGDRNRRRASEGLRYWPQHR